MCHLHEQPRDEGEDEVVRRGRALAVAIGAGRRGQVEEDGGGEGLGVSEEALRRGGHGCWVWVGQKSKLFQFLLHAKQARREKTRESSAKAMFFCSGGGFFFGHACTVQSTAVSTTSNLSWQYLTKIIVKC